MTPWQTRREVVGGILTMWRVFRVVDGVEEIEGPHYSFQDDAIHVMNELNAKEKAPETAATAHGAEK